MASASASASASATAFIKSKNNNLTTTLYIFKNYINISLLNQKYIPVPSFNTSWYKILTFLTFFHLIFFEKKNAIIFNVFFKN